MQINTSDIRGVSLPKLDTNNKVGETNAFLETILNVLDSANQTEIAGNRAAAKLHATGQGDLTQVMMAMEEADMSIKLLVTSRNKIVDAYNEIMHMQV